MKLMKKVSMSIILGISLLPIQIFAHGTEDEHKKEIVLSTYFLAGFTILFILFLALFLVTRNKARQLQNAKKQEDRVKRQQLTKTSKILKWVWIVALVGTVISGVVALSKNQEDGFGLANRENAQGAAQGTKDNADSHNESDTTLMHVHGLGYSPDGESIMIPAHDGLKVYSGGKWSDGQGEKHDYMGFSAVNDGFYSSGHPALGSSKKNPFGIVKSTDGGNSFKTLTLYGKVDFHLMNVSFDAHTIYVMNPQSNPEMKETGLYYSIDEAKTWVKSQMGGFNDEPAALAVHPDNDAIVALGSQEGLYISKDHGDNFEKLSDIQVTSLYFNPAGKLVIGGYAQGTATLSKMDIESGEQAVIEIPVLTEDAVMYVAQNPVNEQEMVFATFNKDVYLSEDQGMSWTKIANKGKGISE
jgi:phosphoribosyl-AMP cyclohydrolase